MEVTDIAKIVRKNIRFWILQMKTCEVMAARNDSGDVGNSQSRTCKECEKKNVFDFTDENSYKRQSC